MEKPIHLYFFQAFPSIFPYRPFISPRAGPQDLPHCGGLALRGAAEDAADSGRLELGTG